MLPLLGIARVRHGSTLLAQSHGAVTTCLPEANGRFLVPERDVRMAQLEPDGDGQLRIPGGDVVAWRDAGHYIRFDPARLNIDIEDAWPGGADTAGTVNRFPRWGDIADLMRLMDLQPAGPDLFAAPIYEDRRRNVVEGSQLLAQAIVAASKTVPDQRAVSAHMIFSRPARFDLPLLFRSRTLRRGRSFSTVSVEVEQEAKPIASALILMDIGAADAIRNQIAMPVRPGPDDCPFFDFGMTGRDVRFVNGDYTPDPDRIGPPELNAWVRHRKAPAEPYLRQALLAQFTGHLTIAAALLPHPGFGEAQAHVTLSTGVLAITVALHEDPDLTGWLLYSNPSIYAGRGLAQGEGHVFTSEGRLAASYSVQAMIRDFAAPPESFGLDATRLM
jgi:acyl-CoA thioesterase